ncbi:hypothetical protein Y032_0310g2120 [Ancylostoma ceylanicum]|uniref:Uncharacterized protein n=1 Tax=Ancylostoma ceylanicum TaxID=53326 RepID=A0A016S2R0_9BILA|nr:hypothetical protein Y032_0310g2120 [Ancylostoma ceylanicum]
MTETIPKPLSEMIYIHYNISLLHCYGSPCSAGLHETSITRINWGYRDYCLEPGAVSMARTSGERITLPCGRPKLLTLFEIVLIITTHQICDLLHKLRKNSTI